MKSSTHGFTLTELLCVIAVLAILTALGVSGMQQVLPTVRRAQAAANLRQLGTVMHTFVTEQGVYPPGSGDFSSRGGGTGFWYDIISPYLGSTAPNTSWSGGGLTHPISPVLDSPAKTIRTSKPVTAFIANPNIMVDLLFGSSSDSKSPLPGTRIFRPSEIILLMDGAQNSSTGVVRPYASSIPKVTNADPARANEYFASFPNVDDASYLPRFPHDADPKDPTKGYMQALFCDGHVDTLENGKVQRKHFSIGY